MSKKEKKSTIKFQKTKLKGVVKKRKEVNKFKRQVQRRQIRRAASKHHSKDQGQSNQDEPSTKEEEKEENVPQINTEDYFCNFIIDPEEQLDLSDDEESDLNVLDTFEDNVNMDEEEGEEPALSDEEEEEESEEDEDEYESMEEDEDIEEEKDDNSEPVTMDMLNEWCLAASKKSIVAWKKLLMAFRSIVRSGDNTEFSYHVGSSKVYTKLVKYTLKTAYPILSKHIYFLKKEKYPGKTKNWPKLEKAIRLFLNNCVRFLRELSDDDIIQYVLQQLEPCTLYFGPFPKILTEYLRVLLDRWSDVGLSEETRQCCYRAVRQLGTAALDANRKNHMPNVLKGVYLVFAHRATKLNETSFSVIQQMLEEAADLYTVDHQLSYEHAHVYISQLADHLKKAKKEKTVESFKRIYTWQYISCLDFWANVISVTCDPTTGETSPMQAVVHPLVDLCLHTMRLNPVSQFLPLRIHLIRTLITFIDSTGYYIPLASYLYETLSEEVFKGRSKQADLPEFNWNLHLKTPKSYLQTKEYQDAVYNAAYDCLLDFYACLGLSIAFPELVIPAVDKLKEFASRSKGTKFARSLRVLIERLETHKNFIEQKRAPIEYTPSKLEEAMAFLRATDFEGTPLGKFLKQRSKQMV
ncbi:Noc2-domain-containing protein [Rhizopus microsporus var. microsporus]|uniref:Noc2-domain-containing protein n=2 Tax=Rhizopus microsporus TaxID=58291 RepID=A0A2G4SWG1_RHIZD|nr:Noc2-domain-containing protein [Rhizopus microsporus ATCC 52813]ORE01527.1 Noc2-domain-containing protein [Rhizopus microsporus var. microsporus]PHZ13128.1 Noc2-domain-containing protein [Rhizopus microsporus ATCC 52813]